MSQTMTDDEKRKIWGAMRVPVFAFHAYDAASMSLIPDDNTAASCRDMSCRSV